MPWHELWQKLQRTPLGQEVAYQPDELKADLQHVQPVFELSEVIRPRLVLTVTLPDGANFLVGISYHTKKQAFQARARFRYPNGDKHIYPAGKWRTCTEAEFATWTEKLIRDIEEFGKTLGGTPATLVFGPDTTNEELCEAFSASGVFDVMIFDPQASTAKRVA